MNVTIALTMIVKNEEEHLTACLESVQDQVDEIIIVDTGSTDDTLAIAKRYTPDVFEYPWHGDFSAARNYAIEKASCSWIFSLDADEILLRETGTLKEIIQQHKESDAFLLPLENPTTNPTIQVNRYHVLRLFKNKPSYRFSGIIHEQVTIQNADSAKIVRGPVIRHLSPSVSVRNSKRARNLNLLTQALAQDPQNPFFTYYLGIEWLMLNKPEKALPYLSTAYTALPDENLLIKAPALRSLIICLQSLGKIEEALILCLEADFRYPEFTDIYYLAGTLFTEKGEFSLAIKWFKQALECGEPPEIYSHMQGTESYLSHYYLGYCFDMLGDGETARNHYETSLQLNPKYPYPLMNLFLNLRLSKGLAFAYNYLKNKEYLKNLELSQSLANEFFNAGYANFAKKILLKHIFELDSCVDSGSKDSVLFALGNYALFTGELTKAQDYLGKISPSSEFFLKAWLKKVFGLLLGSCYREAGKQALDLWKQHELRAQAFLLLKFIKVLQNENVSFLPQTICHEAMKEIAIDWFKEMLSFLPDSVEHPQYSHFMRSLQALIVNISPQSALELINVVEQKKKEVETALKDKFGEVL